MPNGMRPQKVTLPIDAVTLHRWIPDRTPQFNRWDLHSATDNARQSGVFGEQIGERIRVSEPGTVTFPPHRGAFDMLHVVGWHGGQAIWYGGPLKVYDGTTVSIPAPIEGVLS